MHPVLQVQAAPAVIIPVVTTVFHVSWWWLFPISPSWNVFSWSVLFGSNVTLYDSWGVRRRGTSFTDSLSQDLLDLFQTLSLSNQLQLHLKGKWNINLFFRYSARKKTELNISASARKSLTNFIYSGFLTITPPQSLTSKSCFLPAATGRAAQSPSVQSGWCRPGSADWSLGYAAPDTASAGLPERHE